MWRAHRPALSSRRVVAALTVRSGELDRSDARVPPDSTSSQALLPSNFGPRWSGALADRRTCQFGNVFEMLVCLLLNFSLDLLEERARLYSRLQASGCALKNGHDQEQQRLRRATAATRRRLRQRPRLRLCVCVGDELIGWTDGLICCCQCASLRVCHSVRPPVRLCARLSVRLSVCSAPLLIHPSLALVAVRYNSLSFARSVRLRSDFIAI